LLTFAEEILLLILDDKSGKLDMTSLKELHFILAGAVLMDLADRDKIDNDLEKLIVTDSSATGIKLLDPYLAMIAQSEETFNTRYWLNQIVEYGDEIKKEALGMLIEKGILKVEEKKILWVFGVRRYPTIDDSQEKEVRHRITDLLNSDDIPTPHDVVLVSLANTFKLFPSILGSDEAERLAPRIAQIAKLDLIGQAVSQLLNRLYEDRLNFYMYLPY